MTMYRMWAKLTHVRLVDFPLKAVKKKDDICKYELCTSEQCGFFFTIIKKCLFVDVQNYLMFGEIPKYVIHRGNIFGKCQNVKYKWDGTVEVIR